MKSFYSTALFFLLTTTILSNNNLKNQTLGFIKNNGQVTDQLGNSNSNVLYVSSNNEFKLILRNNGFSYEVTNLVSKVPFDKFNLYNEKTKLEYNRIDVDFLNSNKNIEITADEKQHDVINYAKNGATLQAEIFKTITYKNIYKNIDLVFKITSDNQLKYDFVLHAGANYKDIKLKYNTDQKLEINTKGEFIIGNDKTFKVTEHTPKTFHTLDDKLIESSFQLQSNELSFNLDINAITNDVIIDPLITWATYQGGNSSDINTSVCKKGDSLYVVGYTNSSNNISSIGSYQGFYAGGADAFISLFNTNGNRLWTTYYGGIENNYAMKCDVDNNYNVYVCGFTENSAVLTNANFLQSSYGGGSTDAFVSKFSSSGNLVWGSYFGGAAEEIANSIYVDPTSQNIMVVGRTSGTGLPLFANSGHVTFQNTYGGGLFDGFVLKITPTSSPLYSTYYGGSAVDVLFDVKTNANNGEVIFVGHTDSPNNVTTSFPAHFQADVIQQDEEALMVKMTPNGTRMWGTYFGGASFDRFYALDFSSAACNKIVATGYSSSTNIQSLVGDTLKTKSNFGGKDAIIACYSDSGKACNFKIYGGPNDDEATGVDFTDLYAYVTIFGNTKSTTGISFGVLGVGASLNGGEDAFIASFQPNLDIRTSDYWGGANDDKVYDMAGTNPYYLSGFTASTASISTLGAFQSLYAGGVTDAFLNKLYVLPYPPPTVGSPCCLGGGYCSAPPLTVSVCANVIPPTIIITVPYYDDEQQSDYIITLPDGSQISASVGTTFSVLPGQTISTTDQYGSVYLLSCLIPDLYTYPIPTVTAISNDYDLCVGECATLTATYFGGTPTYTGSGWGTGIQTTTLQVCPSGNAPCVPYIYGFTVVDSHSCIVTENVTINVLNPIPTQTLYPVCDYSVALNLSPSCYYSTASYTWVPFNANNVIGQNSGLGNNINNPLVLIDQTISGSISYSVQGNYLGCTSTPTINTITVQLNPVPKITSATPQPSICSGSIFSYTPSATIASTNYSINAFASSGSPFGFLPFSNLSYINNNLFTSFSNGIVSYNLMPHLNGCFGPVQTVTVLVYSLPTLATTSSTYCFGQTPSLNANIIGGTPSYSVQWATATNTLNGLGPINPSTSVTTTYSVSITDSHNCKSQNTYSLFIDNAITAPPVVIYTTACANVSINVNLPNNTTNIWSPNLYITGASGNTTTINPPISTTYSVIKLGNYGCKSTSTVNTTIYSVPFLAANNNTFCFGETPILNANGNIFGGTPTYTVLWATATNTLNGLGPINPSTSVTTTYSVYITDANNCKSQNIHNLYVDNVITATPVSIFTTTCANSSVTVNLPNNTTNIWSPNIYITGTPGNNTTITPSNSVVYNVTKLGNYGCTSTSIVNITAFSTPVLSIASPSICYNTTATLSAVGNMTGGTPTYSINWVSATGTLTGLGPFVGTYSQTTTYSVQIVDANGCLDNESITVFVDNIITGALPQLDTSVCAGLPLNLNIPHNNNFTWTPNTYIVNNSANTTTIIPNTSINYTVVGSGNFGCTTSATVSINILKDATILADFDFEIDSCLGKVNFNTVNQSTNYYWNFGDGTSLSNNKAFTDHTYNNGTQTYTVVLIQTNPSICSNYPIVIDTIIKTFTLPLLAYNFEEIPNVFTPNGDGVNDIFKIASSSCQDIEMIIYDRWGKEVLHTNSNQWDGKRFHNGANADDGTYFYIINYSSQAPKKSHSGFLTLFR